ncbi:Neuralized-like protein 4 [Folsomia candida]|uniref:Neuralized-like protein 4 n=1 Tax=Folsomia candida TaxID=158441 RepID=A0A226E154_FOLCA|nr:Neuralized-like protein 4 [Folsomia candida]
MYRFHPLGGPLVQFSNDFRTAERLKAKTDFDGGLVFSEDKLETNTIFQVRIEKKVGLWSGGLEIGVTQVDPNSLTAETVPRSGTEMRNGTWLMTSSTILHDSQPIIENYGFDLEKLEEGDTVGLMRTKQGALVFFIAGVSQGVALSFVPADIYCVVNLYGKCAMISLVNVNLSEQSTNTVEHVVHEELPQHPELGNYSNTENNSENDKLRFHTNFGPLVKLSNNQRTAERRRPLEEFNNSVVRIDTLIHKWSGSIEFGLITHSPESFSGVADFPATLTVVGNGTVIMSGNGVLHDGKATNSPYTNFNLDQLQEGDRIGVMRKSNGNVIYFVNGESHGVATNISNGGPIWGCCNLYGMAAKVSIVVRNEREEHNLRVTTRNPQDFTTPSSVMVNTVSAGDELMFHPNCGFHAAVINNGRTAHRPESTNDFNHGVVLTNRILHPSEMFEIRLDKIVTKWAGSIEIGVTTHAPTSLDYPCTMTNVRSGTWMMTGNGVMHNGQSIIDEYGQSLDRLKVGDCVGVLRKENGNLHFFVNGADQGCAASHIPDNVYGVIDLYGQAAQATIITHSGINSDNNYTSDNIEDSKSVRQLGGRSVSGESMFSGDLKFHHLHGKNARISSNGLTACRPNALGEFNAAIVVSSRALKDNELFEVVIERMVDRWSGNIEAGVTMIKPENLIFPNTMTDLVDDGIVPTTIMLSGSSIMSGGNTITNRYLCNLDCLSVGSKVGMMRKSDGMLHFFINGEDMGAAPIEVPSSVFAVIDLYGQCAQVSITRVGDVSLVSSQAVDSLSFPFNDTSHRFSVCCGKNIVLKNNNLTATRIRHYNNALIFSSAPLDFDETFEIRISEINSKWTGALMLGVTSLGISDEYPSSHIPAKLSAICSDTWFIKECAVYKNHSLIRDNYCVNLNRLCVGDRVGVKISQDGTLRFLINGEEMGCAATNVPKRMHVAIDLFGSCESVLITSTMKAMTTSSKEGLDTNALAESALSVPEDNSPTQPGPSSPNTAIIPSTTTKRYSSPLAFSSNHSRNIELLNGNFTAKRTSGYQGFVFSNQILQKGKIFEIRIDQINPKWTSNLMVGVLECNPERIQFPFNALGLKKACWLVMGDDVFRNGIRTSEKIGVDLNTLKVGQTVGLMVDSAHNLHIIVGSMDNVIACNVGSRCRALVVLYGEAEQITILGKEEEKELSLKNELTEKEVLVGISRSSIDLNPRKFCEYLDACLRFKRSLVIPDAFFVPTEPTVCFCEPCIKSRGEKELIGKQGDPPVEYTLPLGWVRFPINIIIDNLTSSTSCNQNASGAMTTSTSSLSNVLTTWHVAYHGLEIFRVRDVMDCGQLIAADGETACEEEKDEKSDNAELIFSNVLEYAAIPEFSPTHSFIDSRTRKRLDARVALQILVQPNSYKVGSPTHPMPSRLLTEGGINLDNIQWSTKEQGSTHVSALLVKLGGYFND